MVAYARRDFSGIAIATTLASGINNSDTTISIAASTGWPAGTNGHFFILIENESIEITSRTGTTLTVANRGAEGTSAASHSSGVPVVHTHGKTDLDEANLAVAKTIGLATAVGQVPVVDAANSFAMVQGKTAGQVMMGNGTTTVSQALSGDVTVDGSGVATIGASKITSAKIVDGTIATGDIANAAVDETKLAASVAGNGLAGGAGTALSVGVDGSTIEISSDAIRVKDGGITSAKIADGTIVAADHAAATITQALMAAGLQVPVICTSGTRPSTLTEGMLIYETDTHRLLQYTTATTLWRQPWNMPWGMLDSQQSVAATALASGVASETVGLQSTSVTVPANRKLRIRGNFKIAGTAGAGAIFRIRRTNISGTVVGRTEEIIFAALGVTNHSAFCEAIDSPPAGAIVYVMTADTGDIDNPSYMTVEDVGPNAAPA